MDVRLWSRRGTGLVAGVVAAGVVLAGCGSGKSSSSTSSTSAGQTLKQWEVRVKNGSSAQAPTRSFMEQLAGLLGWPQIAEASTGVPGCSVSAPGPNGQVNAVTDANGKAVLVNVITPSQATVNCPGVPGGQLIIPINGPPGSIIEVEVETNNGGLRVEAEAEDASPSEPSVSEPSVSEPSVSEPSVPSVPRSGSNSGKG
jgi:hypothetical protein